MDPYAAQWLRNLIAAGHIAPGDVDERSIEDVKPDDIQNYTQCHFFAGIGVWSYALRNAGWPDDKPVWTGSCPCQPFSAAGKGDGFDDERHLWPHFHWLISECRPEHVLGEQVASGNANAWFDLVQADLETMGYAFGIVPFPSAGVGSPHIRDRAYWVANAYHEGLEGRKRMPKCSTELIAGTSGVVDRMARAEGIRWGKGSKAYLRSRNPSQTNGFWRDADWLFCRDGKWRPVKPGSFPLANGVTARVGRLRAYGNAINAEAAQTFINAYMEIINGED
ncbi:DNA cytosine methyltransferase [Serratia marcescens]|uniref:DNA cytosine methyltransferase n=1 Tax=Serratia marcescens TaxID=615 RepID=UPI001EB119CF|nr:DNA cytosine methyltransferase [Serratia marcescens]EGT0451674.1 DNA cytosine methyltransferase [Serratia marcescens]MCM2650980.1 DNA cytosine methyltransferase [Serratia marcescens]